MKKTEGGWIPNVEIRAGCHLFEKFLIILRLMGCQITEVTSTVKRHYLALMTKLCVCLIHVHSSRFQTSFKKYIHYHTGSGCILWVLEDFFAS